MADKVVLFRQGEKKEKKKVTSHVGGKPRVKKGATVARPEHKQKYNISYHISH